MTASEPAPIVIRLGERGQNPDLSFWVRVSFGDSAEYDVVVADPADQAGEARLAWYFEEHLRYPFLDKDLEQSAVQQIGSYGEALFEQVFGGAVNYDYRRLRDRGFDQCRIEVSGSAALHQLHWETLKDPDLSTPLAVRLPVTRRVDALGSKFDLPSEHPTLNILVMVARPDGPADVGYRTISQPLLDAIQTAHVPVTVDLVRPGTWHALRDQLRAATEQHGSGWYQVIHFDLHGTFSDYASIERERRKERLLLSTGSLEAFQGRRGFLFFETAEEGKADPVAAERVASLLAEHRVPVAVLNACQSAMQGASDASLAQRLAEAGVPVTMGMAYSVTVSAAEQAMPVLYGRIADRFELTSAVHAARRNLYDHKARRAYFSQQLDLEDWMLPVMFAQRPLQIQLRPMSSPEQAAFYARAAAVGDAPATEYGFVGRDLDIQAIEHRLLTGQACNELLIQGMAGAGKTTMLSHLAWWWQRTGLIHEVFRFSYEDRAWTSGQIIRQIRSRLFTLEECARAETMPDDAQAEQLAQRLRSERHLLILDNAESITATPASIPHALSADEQLELKTLLSRLRGGRTLVLLGSRETEAWLTSNISGPDIYRLSGLDPQAASLLVERILDRHGAAHYLVDEVERAALQDLITLLGGYPLPLAVVLPVLGSSQPSVVLAELRQGGPDVDPANLIYSAIEYSHGKLNPKLQNSLQMFAPFTGAIGTGRILDRYQELLLADESVRDFGPIDLAASLKQAVSVGLAASHSQFNNMVQVQPVLPYFLRSRLRDRPAIQDAADRAHYRLYCELAEELRSMLSSGNDPASRKAGLAASHAEYSNLTTALDYGLRTGLPISPLVLSLDEYLMISWQHVARRRLLDETIARYPTPTTQERQFELGQLRMRAGIAAFDRNSFAEAKEHLESGLKLRQALNDEPGIALSHHELGMVATKQRQFDEAESHFRQSIEITLKLGDHLNAALTYFQLGIMFTERRRLADAEKSYQNALKIFLKIGQLWHVARCHHELGLVAHAQGRLSEAEKNYQYAIEVKLKFGDVLGTAVSHYQLGMLLSQERRYTEAEDSCRRAIQIWLEFGEQHGAAGAYDQIGSMAFSRQRYSEAAANYDKALGIYLEFGNRHLAARIYNNLGALAAHQLQYEEAEVNYRKALASYGDTDRQETAEVTARLGIVIARTGRHEDATAMLLDAAVIWCQEIGSWFDRSLRWLHRERTLITQEKFAAQVAKHVPPALADALTSAIDAVDDPEDGGDFNP